MNQVRSAEGEAGEGKAWVEHRKTVNYASATEFLQAVHRDFTAAYGENPGDPELAAIRVKMQEAEDAQRLHEANKQEAEAAGAGLSDDASMRFGRDAYEKQNLAETALKKWYSRVWRSRQSR